MGENWRLIEQIPQPGFQETVATRATLPASKACPIEQKSLRHFTPAYINAPGLVLRSACHGLEPKIAWLGMVVVVVSQPLFPRSTPATAAPQASLRHVSGTSIEIVQRVCLMRARRWATQNAAQVVPERMPGVRELSRHP
jgi:hypothetical protein